MRSCMRWFYFFLAGFRGSIVSKPEITKEVRKGCCKQAGSGGKNTGNFSSVCIVIFKLSSHIIALIVWLYCRRIWWLVEVLWAYLLFSAGPYRAFICIQYIEALLLLLQRLLGQYKLSSSNSSRFPERSRAPIDFPGWRGIVRLRCVSQEHDPMSHPGLDPTPIDSDLAINIR